MRPMGLMGRIGRMGAVRLAVIVCLLAVIALPVMAATVKETDVLGWTGSAWTRLAKGYLRTEQTATHATLVIGGGYDTSGLTVAATGALSSNSTAQFDGVITSGITGTNGGIVVKSTGAGATTFSVAGATGNTLVTGTMQVDGATTQTGALTANGGISCDSGVFAVADTTGAITGSGPKYYVSVPLLSIAAATTARTGVFNVRRAMTITSATVSFYAYPGSSGGTCVLTLKNADASDTMTEDTLLNAATVDIKAKTAKTPINLTLTATGADLVLAAGDMVTAACINDNGDASAGTGGVLTLEYTLQ
jgi:hypothetical protein